MAYDRPLPKAEIVISVREDLANTIEITCLSIDAEIWLRQEAPLFGLLFEPDTPEYGLDRYRLYVNEAFKLEDVIKYLKTYNKGNIDGTPDAVGQGYLAGRIGEEAEEGEDQEYSGLEDDPDDE